MIAMAIFVAVGANAKSKDSRSVLLRDDAAVAGSHLARGNYSVQWETNSPAATVSFLRDNKVVATAEGKVVDRGSRYGSNEVVYALAANGARVIQELRFKGSSEVIVFNN
jgi:hypothetical protein